MSFSIDTTIPSFNVGMNANTVAAASGIFAGVFFADLVGEAAKSWSGQAGVMGFIVEAFAKVLIAVAALWFGKAQAGAFKVFLAITTLGVAQSILADAWAIAQLPTPEAMAGQLAYGYRAPTRYLPSAVTIAPSAYSTVQRKVSGIF